MMLESTPIITKTDENGYFNFGYVPIGNHRITASDNNSNIILQDTFEIKVGAQNSVEDKTVTATNSIKLKIKQKEDNKAEIGIYSESSNNDILPDGMIPIKYNGDTWVKADKNNTNNDWYNYDETEKRWANAVMVDASVRETYMADTYEVGTEIPEDDILAYFVWIPRYRYKLFNTAFAAITRQTIEIEFESINDPISDGTCNGNYTKPTDNCYYSHPSFWWDNDSDGNREAGEELSGIWVGKFELTGNSNVPTVKPNVSALTNQSVPTQFSTIKKMETNVYLNMEELNKIDVHMIKNMDWGAIIYLSQSKYGKNSPMDVHDVNQITGEGNYSENLTQSTTDNIYGIYDIAGGSFEYVMGIMNSADVSTYPGSKYYDLYQYSTTTTDYKKSRLGDATGETRGWNTRCSMVTSSKPWFVRGGGCYYGVVVNTGAFVYCMIDTGKADTYYSTRPIITQIS